MDESIRAARTLRAQRRISEHAQKLADRAGIEVPAGITKRQLGTPLVVAMKRLEATADLLAELARREPVAVTVADAIRAASDDELLALPGIGPATLTALREGLS